MKCDKSRKRYLLVHWGMKRIAQGEILEAVQAEIRRQMRRTLAEVEEFVKGR